MFTKIKEFFNSTFGKIIAGLTAIVGLLVYFITLKNKETTALNTKIELLTTQKDSDILEVQIKEKLDTTKMLAKEVEEHNKALAAIEERRKQLEEQEKNKTPSQVEDYWGKN